VGELVIATASHGSVLRRQLGQQMPLMLRDGLLLRWREMEWPTEIRVICDYEEMGEPAYEILIYHVASAVTGIVRSSLISQWVQRLVLRQAVDASASERHQLQTRATKTLTEAAWVPGEEILARVMEYLAAHHFMHLEGFASFRLDDHVQRVSDAVTIAIAEWNTERTRHDIVQLLRYFVATADSYVDRVDVFLQRNGRFRLVDKPGHVVDNAYLARYVSDLRDGAVDPGDLLVSTLITLAPVELHCYCETELPVMSMIRDVFQERVTFHQGCHWWRVRRARAGRRFGLLGLRHD
jgi:putative sporulation protein YtxC